jgi:hypothetical protein
MKATKIGGLCVVLLFLGSLLFASSVSISYGVNSINLIRSGFDSDLDNIKYLGSGFDVVGIFGRKFGFYTNFFLSVFPPFSVQFDNVSIARDEFFLPLTAELTLGFGGKGEMSELAGIMFGFGFHTTIVDLIPADNNTNLDSFGWTWGVGGSLILYFNISSSMSLNIGVNGAYDLIGWSTYDDNSSIYSYSSWDLSFARSINWSAIGGIGFHF